MRYFSLSASYFRMMVKSQINDLKLMIMTLNEFIEKFASEFDETPVGIFTAETVYKDLEEWSSLTALSIISMVDEEMEKRITGADIRSCSTIKELFELSESR